MGWQVAKFAMEDTQVTEGAGLSQLKAEAAYPYQLPFWLGCTWFNRVPVDLCYQNFVSWVNKYIITLIVSTGVMIVFTFAWL